MELVSNGNRSSLHGPLHGSLSKFLVNVESTHCDSFDALTAFVLIQPIKSFGHSKRILIDYFSLFYESVTCRRHSGSL